MGKFSFIDKIFGNNTTPKPEVEPNVDPTSTPKADDTKTTVEPAPTVEPTPAIEPTATPTPAVEPKAAVKPALDDMFTVDTSAEQDEPKQDEPKQDEPKQDEPKAEPVDEPKQDEAADTADIADAVDTATDEPTDATDTDPVDAIKEDVKPIDLDNPARRVVTSVADESGYVVGFSIQGRSHISADTLAAVNLLNFQKDVIINRVDTVDAEDIRRVLVAFGESRAGVNVLAVFHNDVGTECDGIYDIFTAVIGSDDNIVSSLYQFDAYGACAFRNDSGLLGLS
ncbi:MAG: hypothetical protein IIX59_00955, partial [Alistipes sp.]|nr:hypothetical protein [Alistipes sp.]